MKIGRRIYYDMLGNVLLDTGERFGEVVPIPVEEEISYYPTLSSRNRESISVIELEYGQYIQDFKECIGYRVNPGTKQLEFTYPDPAAPEEPQPYQPPLSEKVKQLESQQATMQDTIDFILGIGV